MCQSVSECKEATRPEITDLVANKHHRERQCFIQCAQMTPKKFNTMNVPYMITNAQGSLGWSDHTDLNCLLSSALDIQIPQEDKNTTYCTPFPLSVLFAVALTLRVKANENAVCSPAWLRSCRRQMLLTGKWRQQLPDRPSAAVNTHSLKPAVRESCSQEPLMNSLTRFKKENFMQLFRNAQYYDVKI